jgi:uncharacterized repeat protein (TIGR01451 family)
VPALLGGSLGVGVGVGGVSGGLPGGSTSGGTSSITVVKTADQGTITAGQQAGFTVTITNSGSVTDTGITLSDALPAGAGGDITWVIDTSQSGTTPSDFVITGSTGSQQLVLSSNFLTTLGDKLAAGKSISVHITGMTTTADLGPNDANGNPTNGLLSNTATVSATGISPIGSTATITITPSGGVSGTGGGGGAISVVKMADQGTVEAGDTVGFTVTITDNGTTVDTGVTLSDALPAGLGNDITWTIDTSGEGLGEGTAPSDFTITGSVGSQQLVLSQDFLTTLGDELQPGQSISVHITGVTTTADLGPNDANGNPTNGLLSNTATVSATGISPVGSTATITITPPGASAAHSHAPGASNQGHSHAPGASNHGHSHVPGASNASNNGSQAPGASNHGHSHVPGASNASNNGSHAPGASNASNNGSHAPGASNGGHSHVPGASAGSSNGTCTCASNGNGSGSTNGSQAPGASNGGHSHVPAASNSSGSTNGSQAPGASNGGHSHAPGASAGASNGTCTCASNGGQGTTGASNNGSHVPAASANAGHSNGPGASANAGGSQAPGASANAGHSNAPGASANGSHAPAASANAGHSNAPGASSASTEVGASTGSNSGGNCSCTCASNGHSNSPGASNGGGATPEKVAMWHRTGSVKNPWVHIVISENAVAAHERIGDVLDTGNGPPITSPLHPMAVAHVFAHHTVHHPMAHV